MKRALILIGGAVLLPLIIFVVLEIGEVFGFEYAYPISFARVRNASSVHGIPIAKVIRADGAAWPEKLPWHTCVDCGDTLGKCQGLTAFALQSPDSSTTYYFAYSHARKQIVPMNQRTANHFPSLMPDDDNLEVIGKLDRTGVTMENGYGIFMLPTGWYASLGNGTASTSANKVSR